MTPAELQTIKEIFHGALECEPDTVSAFLETACQGGAALRHEVEAFLTAHQQAGNFIDVPVVSLATNILDEGQTRLLIGQTIGHYKIQKRIDAGGMGEVYLASDITAGRRAALKLLPPHLIPAAERLKRFQQEARIVAGLNHPNILTIYEVGAHNSTSYIASELVEGETLRQRLARGSMQLSEAVEIAIQVAAALAAAHSAGVVHRDVKPGNIMLRRDGYVKVLDFGIAKLAEQEVPLAIAEPASGRSSDLRRGMEEAAQLVETHLGSILGTVCYMSPEQARGESVDKRTDIWSLGVVLYEMVARRAPFTGNTPAEVITSILRKEPSPLSSYIAKAPVELQQIVTKALRKDPQERYQNAKEMLDALKGLRHKLEFTAELERSAAAPLWLRWIRSPTALALVLLAGALTFALSFYWLRNPRMNPMPEKSVAVLPFENLSDDKQSSYFAEGIQEEILTRLAGIADLRVISRTSTQRYQSKPGNLSEIAKQLGVANILEGSVQKAADQVRVNVQLVNAQTDSHLWAETYDRKVTDTFGVESEIAKGIAEALQAKLTGREEQALAVKPTNNPEAYDAYLRGLSFEARSAASFTSFYPDLLGKAADSYERAVHLDPNFALAWARLSRASGGLYFNYQAVRRDAAKRALENAHKLAPNSPETLLALGYYQFWVLRDYGLAKTTFGRVRKLLPASSEVLGALGTLLRREGNWDQSIAYFEQALALDPRNLELLMRAALTYGMVRQFPAALKLYDRALDIMPDDLDVMATKASIYQAQGNLQEAARLLSGINGQTSNESTFQTKITQLQFERNYGEAVRLLQARQAQFHFTSQDQKVRNELALAFMQRLAGDTAGAKVTAEQARDTLEQLCRDQPDEADLTAWLSQAYAVMGEKDVALQLAERAITLLPSAKDALEGPTLEGNLALIQTIFGENSRAILILTQLLQTPYKSLVWGQTSITPALLRLDPLWDPLRSDPAFQKLCEEKLDKSIAVLPFENLSNDKQNSYFADGVQDEILGDLAKIADLKVISRTSVMQYKSGIARNLREIGQQLGVAHVVEGSVQRSGNRVRVNAQLIDARTDGHLWGQTYDRELTDIFAVESDVAKTIAETLRVRLTGAEESAIAARPTKNSEAHDLYLRGRYFFGKRTSDYFVGERTGDDLKRAIDYFNQAIAKDPNYAPAYAGLADSYALLPNFSSESPAEVLPKAKLAADKALAIDDNLAEAHVSHGLLLWRADLNFKEAKREFVRAIELNPNYAPAHYFLAVAVLAPFGQFDQAIAELKRAVELDPFSMITNAKLGYCYFLARRYPEAVAQFRKTTELDPNFPYMHTALGEALELNGDSAGAMREYEKAYEIGQDLGLALLAHAYAMKGDRERALQLLSQLQDIERRKGSVEAYSYAIIYLSLGENSQAVDWLERSYRAKELPDIGNIKVNPMLDPLRGDPRFQKLANQVVPPDVR